MKLHRLARRAVKDSGAAFVRLRQRVSRVAHVEIRIVVYHAIRSVPADADPSCIAVPAHLFEGHMAWLRDKRVPVLSLLEAYEVLRGARPLRQRAVVLTFDDGYADVCEVARPVLRHYGFPATAFLVSGTIGSKHVFPWVDPSTRPYVSSPLSTDQVRELLRNGWTLGSHSMTHPKDLSSLPDDVVRRELEESKADLERAFGTPVRFFAYPYGAGPVKRETIGALQHAGYLAACTNLLGAVRIGDNPFALRRVRIEAGDTLCRFGWKLSGAYDWIDGPRCRSVGSRLAQRGFA